MPEERRQAFFDEESKRIPLGMIAEPDHVAAMVMSALTNPFVTGTCLVVDGGTTAV
jgi:NAD(P)-dependent dehydrogenase (short-subunit alcohol dehydrogenase family)